MADTQFKVTIPNLPKIQAALAQFPQIAAPIVQRAIVASQALLAKFTNASTVPVRTGYLVQNWAFEIGNLQARWYPRAVYAPYVEGGTGIYGPNHSPIVPKDKKALYWPGAAHPMRSIKGQKPNPFMERIIAAAQPEIDQLFGTAMDQITQAIASQTNG